MGQGFEFFYAANSPAMVAAPKSGGTGDFDSFIAQSLDFGEWWQVAPAPKNPWLVRDEFRTNAAAPLPSPRTAEPGPGTLNIVDTNAKMSISGGLLTVATPNVANNPVLAGTALTRVAGRASFAVHRPISTFYLVHGFSSAAAGSTLAVDLGFLPTNLLVPFDNGIPISVTESLPSGHDYAGFVVLRPTGALYIYKDVTVNSPWRIGWVGVANSIATLYPNISEANNNTAGAIDNLRAIDLPAPFDSAFGLATQRLAGARAQSDAFVHEASFYMEYTVTTLPTSAHQVCFWSQDSNNEWFVRHGSNGDLNVYERIAGSTSPARITALAVLANGHRVVVVGDPATSTVRIYSGAAPSLTLRGSYTAATNFTSQTKGRFAVLGDGAISDLITWPRQLSGYAAAILDDAAAPSADVAVTFAAMTLAATGQLTRVAQAAITLAGMSASATGQSGLYAQAAITFAAMTSVSVAALYPVAVLNVTFAAMMLSSGALVARLAVLAVTFAPMTLRANNYPIQVLDGAVYSGAGQATVYGPDDDEALVYGGANVAAVVQ